MLPVITRFCHKTETTEFHISHVQPVTHQGFYGHVEAAFEERTPDEEPAAALLTVHARTLLYRLHGVVETGRHTADVQYNVTGSPG